jgi:hypothetical protein
VVKPVASEIEIEATADRVCWVGFGSVLDDPA